MAKKNSGMIARRRKIRQLEAKRDTLLERGQRDRTELKKVRAELKEARKQ